MRNLNTRRLTEVAAMRPYILIISPLKPYLFMENTSPIPTKNIWSVIIRAVITILSAISGAFFGSTMA